MKYLPKQSAEKYFTEDSKCQSWPTFPAQNGKTHQKIYEQIKIHEQLRQNLSSHILVVV